MFSVAAIKRQRASALEIIMSWRAALTTCLTSLLTFGKKDTCDDWCLDGSWLHGSEEEGWRLSLEWPPLPAAALDQHRRKAGEGVVEEEEILGMLERVRRL